MGKQTNIKLRGTVENVIYYQWREIHCMRAVPAHVRQTKNTKKVASQFGVAVKSAAAIRLMLRPYLQSTIDRSVIYGLDGAFRKWLYSNPLEHADPMDMLAPFTAFSFNKDARPGKLFGEVSVSRVNNHDLMVHLPAINPLADVTVPKGTTLLGLQFITTLLPFNKKRQPECITANVSVPYEAGNLPAQEILLPDTTSLHCLTLVVMCLRYYKNRNETGMINQARWKPVAIVGSFYN